ncbi:MAG: DUF92 domain-containing protein [Candidatus Neomarinimicrobiota bacterium]|jgi:uncharacterized protein (TIGR00297 family)|nr:DUF92 domain-containing protein [Candidatus Neomarinimicrobiota bacterium]
MHFLFHEDWGLFIVFTMAILLILGLATALLKLLKIHPHHTRRLVHILVGCLVCAAPFIFESRIPVLTLTLLFTLANILAIRFKLIKSIHETDRISYGTVYFPVSFFILVFWFWDKDPAILLTAMLIMAFADPVASWVGESRKKPLLFKILSEKKSLQGSSAMFVTAFIVAVLAMKLFRGMFDQPDISWTRALIFGFFTAIYSAGAETISHRGTDNLMVPIGAGVILDAFYHGSTELQLQLMVWMGITVFFAYLAYKTRSLSLSGAMGAWLLGTVIFGLGGPEWMTPVVVFFIFSSILTKIGKTHKKKLETVFEKTGKRDIYQVFANGGVAMIATMCWHFFEPVWPDSEILWYMIFLSAVAAATADTWGTEIGAFSRKDPRSILGLKKVPMGTSGGLSLIGTMGAALGALIIALTGKFALQIFAGLHLPLYLVGLITLAGLCGALVDSLLGATVQAQYECPRCHKITEKMSHCGQDSIPLKQGCRMINNDFVNFCNTVAGGLLGGILYLILY